MSQAQNDMSASPVVLLVALTGPPTSLFLSQVWVLPFQPLQHGRQDSLLLCISQGDVIHCPLH